MVLVSSDLLKARGDRVKVLWCTKRRVPFVGDDRHDAKKVNSWLV